MYLVLSCGSILTLYCMYSKAFKCRVQQHSLKSATATGRAAGKSVRYMYDWLLSRPVSCYRAALYIAFGKAELAKKLHASGLTIHSSTGRVMRYCVTVGSIQNTRKSRKS